MAKKRRRGGKVQRVEIDCIFRTRGFPREFITPHNKEAFNILMNKLDKKGVKNQRGKLVFEFDEQDKSGYFS